MAKKKWGPESTSFKFNLNLVGNSNTVVMFHGFAICDQGSDRHLVHHWQSSACSLMPAPPPGILWSISFCQHHCHNLFSTLTESQDLAGSDEVKSL